MTLDRELMRDVFQDLRYSVRSLARTPGSTVPAILTLALGIGATARSQRYQRRCPEAARGQSLRSSKADTDGGRARPARLALRRVGIIDQQLVVKT